MFFILIFFLAKLTMVHYEIVFSVKDTYEGSCFKICPKEVSVALPFKWVKKAPMMP